MRIICLTFLALILSACSIQGIAERIIPDDVQERASRNVDAVMAGDLDFVRTAFADEAGEDFDAAMAAMMEQVRAGEERARNIVGAQASVSTSTDEGSSRSYNIAYEVETPEGFTVISQSFASQGDDPLALTSINIQGSDDSMAAQLRRIGTAVKLIGGALLLAVLLLAFWFFRGRKRAHAES